MEFHTRNSQMEATIAQARKLARMEHAVIIYGESGTGKDRLARFLHHQSERQDGPFIQVDCAGLSAPGDLETAWSQAMTGTLFLDRAHDLSLMMQARLISLLQQPGPAPRIISASTRELAPYKERGQLREDLYCRLTVLQLKLPPLRDRKEDIQLLTEQFLAHVGRPAKLAGEAIAALLLYDWPCNVRELEATLAHAAAMAGPDGEIGPEHLPNTIAATLQSGSARQLFKRYMRSAEFLIIKWALGVCSDDRTRTARYLGLSRAALYKKLKLYPELSSGSLE